MKKFDLIGVGSPIVDSLAHVDENFISTLDGEKGGMELVDDETITSIITNINSTISQVPGGSAANTIFGTTKLGLSTTFLGKLGNDDKSKFYKNQYDSMGGDLSHFKSDNSPNGHCLSLITPDSQRTMRTFLGAAMNLSPDEITTEDFSDSRHAHIEGYILFNQALMNKVLQSAKEAGCSISLDLASFEVVNATKDSLKNILNEYIDIVFANEEEAAAFTGIEDNYEVMAQELSKLCKIAVVKIGKDGAIICAENKIYKIDAILADEVVDTTGAGDLWAAGFLFGYLTNKSIEESGSYGSLLGSAVVQIIGAAIPDEKWKLINNKIN